MGVQNLWMLLAPVGRQIEIETLSTKVLAVDASIWLTQFIKAMRDDEGNMIKNAHLIGTFHRVAKLLFYRIRPVFVFDGNTPEIKKRTVARRRRRQEHQAANLKQTAQRILLNRLKLYREELKKNGGKPVANSAVAPDFVLPGTTGSATNKDDGGVITIDDSDEEDAIISRAEGDNASGNETTSTACEVNEEEETKSESEDDEMTADDIDLDTSRLSRIDLDAVFALPGHLQKDMIARIQRDRRQEARDQFIPLAGNPEAYSRTQISSFLKTSKLNRQIMKARQKNAQQEMEKAATEAASGGGAGGGLLGHGRRIASSSDRFFIYEKAKNRDSDGGSGDDVKVLAPNSAPLQDNEAENWKLTGATEATQDDENDDDIFARIHGSKRKRRYLEDDTVTVKRSLGEFSIAAVPEVAAEMGRSQRRKIAVEAARRQFLEREKYKQEEKPLAIEEARAARRQDQQQDKGENQANIERKGAITIAFKADDISSLDKHVQDLFPKSMFVKAGEPVKQPLMQAAVLDNDDKAVEWENVNAPVPHLGASHVATPPVSKTPDVKFFAQDDGEDDVEWEDVAVSAPEESVGPTGTSPHGDDVQWEDVPHTEPSNYHAGSFQGKLDKAKQASVLELDQESSEEEAERETSDLYESLQGEMEEERAEDDLTALKEEALKSAIATASNLTQWAAGAVRRALAQHTRQALVSSPSQKTSSPEQYRQSPTLGSREEAIDVSEIETVHVTSGHSNVEAESDDGAKQFPDSEEPDDRLLQFAIEKSMAESNSSQPLKTSSSRYLQYAASPEPELPIDIAAIADEQRELKKLRNRQMRDVEGVNEEMVQDVMELLQLFGVPYLVCPMEAEAQCAALEQLGLVDGIITDDSDIFPFGGRKVYKNIFHNQKFVEAFLAQDVEKELGFSQEEMIALAMLLGSDYTDGVRGIGIVNASEVVSAYPGLDGLKEFKEWVQSFDVAEEARRRLEKKKTQAEIDMMSPRERFEYTHANVRRKWELGEEFPNQRVVQAYKNPQVDRSDSRFSWELPNLAGLREYCTSTFGWDQGKTDTVLLPLMEQIASFANERQVQTRIDQFFTRYEDNVKYAKIQSKRLRSAVEGKTGKTPGTRGKTKSPAKKTQSQAQAASSSTLQVMSSAKFKKTKKTTSTLGL